ncbi:MAG: hypothetical protein FH749_02655 [Firmicutes bacterium]|nr:hypothetical protein [Bacillota bacterium]
MDRNQQFIELERYLEYVDDYLNKRGKRAKAESEQWEFEAYFPYLLHTTVFLTMYALLETGMNDVCYQLQMDHNYEKGLEDIKGTGIQRAASYLKEVCKLNFPETGELWRRLKAYNHLRNVLMHALGKPDADDHQARDLVQSSPHLRFEDGGKIVLSKEFCREALSDARELFKVLDELTSGE